MNAGPIIFFAAMLAVLWFVLIRPQRQRQATHRALVAQLDQGDEVITAGGVFGTVRKIADDHLVIEIAPGTEIRLAKDAVATVVPKDAEITKSEQNGG